MKLKLKDILFYVLAAIVLIIIVRRCACGPSDPPVIEKKIIDTVYIYTKKDTMYVPKEIKVVQTQYVPKYITDTLEIREVVFKNVDTAKILRDYYAARFYSDTQKIDYGKIIINDRISRNRIIGRRLVVEQNIPVVEKTITLKEKKRNVLYAGLSVVGNEDDFVHAIGADLGMKLKNDKFVGVGIKSIRNGTLYYEAQLKFPIRLKKK